MHDSSGSSFVARLSYPEQIAIKAGKIQCVGWQCPHCLGECHIRRYSIKAYQLPPDNALFLEPGGQSRSTNINDAWAYCTECGEQLHRQTLNPEDVCDRLSRPEQVALKLGSLQYTGWHCRYCLGNVHIRLNPTGRRLVADLNPHESASFYQCPNCCDLTAIETLKEIQAATPQQNGVAQITIYCHCCGYKNSKEQPLLYSRSNATLSNHNSSSNTSDNWSSSSSDDSSWSSSSSSDSWTSSSDDSSWSSSSSSDSWTSSSSDNSWSSSDFGGGSSGGGGAGGSW